MNTPQDALNHLNDGSRSHLSELTRLRVKQMQSEDQDPQAYENAVQQFISEHRGTLNPLAYVELLAILAVFNLDHKRPQPARKTMLDAIARLPDDPQRKAICLWLLGQCEWALFENVSAYTNWENAIELMRTQAKAMDLEQSAQNASRPDLLILEMESAFDLHLERAFTWLNLFEPTQKTQPTQAFVNQLNQIAYQRNNENTTAQIEFLLDMMRYIGDPLEECEVQLECGLIHYSMGNFSKAMHLLHVAAGRLTPDSHNQAVARWMMGLASLRLPALPNHPVGSPTEKAAADCDSGFGYFNEKGAAAYAHGMTYAIESVAIFEKLQEQAIHMQQLNRAEWYCQHVQRLRRGLEMLAQRNLN